MEGGMVTVNVVSNHIDSTVKENTWCGLLARNRNLETAQVL